MLKCSAALNMKFISRSSADGAELFITWDLKYLTSLSSQIRRNNEKSSSRPKRQYGAG